MSVIPYCTDEDIAIRALGDYLELVPKDQRVAAGADGVLAPGLPWGLTAASIPLFQARGVLPGQAVQLYGPQPAIPVAGDMLIVDGPTGPPVWTNTIPAVMTPGTVPVTGPTLPLRRKGQGSGQGDPPLRGATLGAGLAGITFAVWTVLPQILVASQRLDQEYGVDDLVWSRRHADQYDPSELRDLTTLRTLHKLYVAAARGAAPGSNIWWDKAKEVKEEMTTLEQRVALLWRSSPEGQDKSDIFSSRIVRG